MKTLEPEHIFTYAGATINVYRGSKGTGLPKHDHSFTHATYCTSGSIRVTKENVDVVLKPEDKPVNLKANEWHQIECLEKNTAFINVFETGKV